VVAAQPHSVHARVAHGRVQDQGASRLQARDSARRRNVERAVRTTQGYLPSGNSLPNMPITFGGKFVHKREDLGAHCSKACERCRTPPSSMVVATEWRGCVQRMCLCTADLFLHAARGAGTRSVLRTPTCLLAGCATSRASRRRRAESTVRRYAPLEGGRDCADS